MAKETKLTNEEFIEKHAVVRKNLIGHWEASFTCADGYSISCSNNAVGRSVKRELKERLIQTVLAQTKHPIQ